MDAKGDIVFTHEDMVNYIDLQKRHKRLLDLAKFFLFASGWALIVAPIFPLPVMLDLSHLSILPSAPAFKVSMEANTQPNVVALLLKDTRYVCSVVNATETQE